MPHYRAPLDIVRTARIRNTAGQEIVAQASSDTRRRFAMARELGKNATHVVIPVHNEADDLPATLLSLSLNPNVSPLVVANRCSDQTAAIARHMGARVLNQPTGKKMAATKAGVRELRSEGVARILFTDGDTLALPRWSTTLTERLDATDQGYGAVVFGSSVIWHGNSKLADGLMSLSRVAGIIRRDRQHLPPLANGHNYGVQFDPDGMIDATFEGLDDELFHRQTDMPADDTAIQASILAQSYAALTGIATLNSRVITRGDRVDTARAALRIVVTRQPYDDVAASSYAEQYDRHTQLPPAA